MSIPIPMYLLLYTYVSTAQLQENFGKCWHGKRERQSLLRGIENIYKYISIYVSVFISADRCATLSQLVNLR